MRKLQISRSEGVTIDAEQTESKSVYSTSIWFIAQSGDICQDVIIDKRENLERLARLPSFKSESL